MLVGTVHPSAAISKFADNFRVNEHTLLSLIALREKLTLLCRMQILTLLRRLVTARVVTASGSLFTLSRRLNWFFALLMMLLLLLLPSKIMGVDRAKSFESFLSQFIGFIFAYIGGLISNFILGLPILFVVRLLIIIF
jgi:hypothetical protein